jgi:hypothetical protein
LGGYFLFHIPIQRKRSSPLSQNGQVLGIEAADRAAVIDTDLRARVLGAQIEKPPRTTNWRPNPKTSWRFRRCELQTPRFTGLLHSSMQQAGPTRWVPLSEVNFLRGPGS